jgi:signal transduction histidine kinase
MLHNEFDINPNKENKRLIHQIAETATETYALIEKLLNWAQTQTQQIQPKLIPTDIVKTCQTAQNIYKTRMAQKQSEFTYLGPEKYLLNTDENILQTILRNLLSNALKFTNPGGQIILTIVINPRHCQISVRDTGIGMPPEIANNLFVNVVNPTQYGTNRETGTGLGMAICKEFTDKLLGHIEVQSTLNHGTLFTVSLPN